MAKFNFKKKDGSEWVVDWPYQDTPTASDIEHYMNVNPKAFAPKSSALKPFGETRAAMMGALPGATMGRKKDEKIMEWLKRLGKEELPGVAAAVGAGTIGPAGRAIGPTVGKVASTFPARMVGSEVGHQVGSALTGQKEPIPAGTGALQQAGGELLAFPARSMMKGRAAGKAEKNYATLLEKLAEADKARVAAHADTVAGNVVMQSKAAVPAFKGIPESAEGAYTILSDGPNRLSKAIDPVMKSVAQAGSDVPLLIQEIDQKALKIPVMTDMAAPPVESGRQPLVYVNLGEAAKAVQGKWTKYPGMYARVVSKIDELGFGDPAKRAEYKNGMATILMIGGASKIDPQTNKAIFDVKKYTANLSDKKNLTGLRNRGIPVEPFRQALGEGIPQATTPPAAPDITRRSIPLAGHPYSMGALMEAPFLASGQHGYGVPFMTGLGLGNVLPKDVVTKTPMGKAGKMIEENLPGAAAEAVRLSPDALQWILSRGGSESGKLAGEFNKDKK